MIKSLLAAAALAVGLVGASGAAEAKMMAKHHKPAMHAAMCYHTVKGKKHWHHCRPMAKHHVVHHAMKKKMKKM